LPASGNEVKGMKVTPLEIRQQQFPLRFRGYDPRAVDMFLELVAGGLEELIKENAQLSKALARKDQAIQDIREQEGDWKKALLAVQQTADELIRHGEQRAQCVLAEAERKVQQLLLEAAHQREGVERDVRELTRQRSQILGHLHGVLKQQLTLLEAQEQAHA
jgi:cell division initiation protein